MARPEMAPLPGWFFWSARSTLSPSPPAATMLAMVTIARAIMVVWLIPAIMVGSAIGTCTLVRSWKGVVPKERAASTASLDTCRIPRLVRRMTGGTAYMRVAKMPAGFAQPEEEDAREQVHEAGHGLHGVEDGAHDVVGEAVSRAQHAEG